MKGGSMRVNGTLALGQRRKQLSDLLLRGGCLALTEVAGRFGVHEITVRRDLDLLERDGVASVLRR